MVWAEKCEFSTGEVEKINVAEATLSDIRDSNSYKVRKLADGECWMTHNLNLSGNRTINSTNSNVANNYTIPAITISGDCYYYAYGVATAGTDSANAEAPSDICPKGWHLPNNSQFTAFRDIYKNTSVDYSKSPISLDFCGLSGISDGTRGDLWSRNGWYQYGYGITYYNPANWNSVIPNDYNYQGATLPIRCVAR